MTAFYVAETVAGEVCQGGAAAVASDAHAAASSSDLESGTSLCKRLSSYTGYTASCCLHAQHAKHAQHAQLCAAYAQHAQLLAACTVACLHQSAICAFTLRFGSSKQLLLLFSIVL